MVTIYRISKKFEFSAGHALMGLPAEHPCSRIHGHNYVVDLILESAVLDQHDFVRDYNDLKPFRTYLDDVLDHRWLGAGTLRQSIEYEPRKFQEKIGNPVFTFNPTAENIAEHLFEIAGAMGFTEVTMVGVSETPKTWAFSTPLSLTFENLEDALATLPDDEARRRFVDQLKGPQ